MPEAEQSTTQAVTTDEEAPTPEATIGSRPATLYQAPDEAPDLPDGLELVPSPGWCWIECKYSGTGVREAPSPDAPRRGVLSVGDKLDAKWHGVEGAAYNGCGGSGRQWIPVWYDGRWSYVASLCVAYYKPS